MLIYICNFCRYSNIDCGVEFLYCFKHNVSEKAINKQAKINKYLNIFSHDIKSILKPLLYSVHAYIMKIKPDKK